MILLRVFVSLFFLVITCLTALGQERDSIIIRNDTAYIIKKPVVITKKVYVKTSKPTIKKKPGHFYLMPYFQVSYSLDYITVCDLKRRYYDLVDEYTQPRLNYTFGGMVMFRKDRFLINADVGYTNYRERFAMQETSTLNKHQVLTATLDFGYALFKKRKKYPFEILVMGGVGYLRTLEYSGSTVDKNDYINVITLSELDTYDSSSLIASGKIIGSYQLTKTKTLLFGPTYSTNILSITRESVPFGKWRHNIGWMVGVGIGL
ncbi:hypothetical protein QQ020_14560 [Fulvivirgaceae bacterium BMA12]|uniref:Outer membrane protein beta-barrel domain-containing protein n=1 Tax=Agaribacillus aureus TaxID=3051825 RepID=A0ABT8LAJ0_9BACT|nr:hypothetical protein [Fulvivirgaceae bacterium BMA12]